MSITQQVNISDLKLDLKNFRTTPQVDEASAIHAMIAVNQNRFHAIIESLLEDEYIPTENIICQKQGRDIIVKEGNRRIAAMKLILGLHKPDDFQIPDSIKTKIAAIDVAWKSRNQSVPCSVYEAKETEMVDRIVALTHGKGDKASRDPWTSVARARHNRDVKKGKEEGLNLLEKYISVGRNLNAQQKERWAGDYGVTVLDEALRKIFARLGYPSIADLVAAYPSRKDRDKLEDIMLGIGLEDLSFKEIRNEQVDFCLRFGFDPLPSTQPAPTANPTTQNPNTTPQNSPQNNPTGQTNSQTPTPQTTSGTTNPSVNPATPTTPAVVTPVLPKASATNTQKHVNSLLRKFSPRGNRPKVVTLRDEMLKLKIQDNPIAFCFLLRSIFEISAKAYCDDKSLPTMENGKEKTLAKLLTQVTNDLTTGNNTAMKRVLHGALTEITNPNRLLSVTSMNQLVHSPTFSVQPQDICTLFNNIYPLLEAMN